ncbi:MAG: bifunctional tRNA (5-methylaminomethyl-2-thiouridine)(34)-methyltransferase MnmD/FAD-dependent 5-carboxymethylaminomethyl-2-thiouridine(34) oxidoreductase MnmC [Cellvibrionales bacterium]|jgi:tRNA 5-methylaminomethyl-2-thiouridine biosynthesis bifunctional protein
MIARDNTPWSPCEPALLDWQDRVPVGRKTGDVYYSLDDGVAESRYVFLEGTGMPDRFAEQGAVIAETGFGTGLNFLVTVTAWLEQRRRNPRNGLLHYLGFECFPLTPEQLETAWSPLSLPSEVTGRLRRDWPAPVRGCHRICWHDWGIILDLWWEPVGDALGDLASRGATWVDAWYLDGFAPAKDPDFWSKDLYRHMASLSNPGSRFATFTAAGVVRRGLSAAGFAVAKRPGFGRKRDSLAGHFTAVRSRVDVAGLTPWDITDGMSQPLEALVLGAGLAGCFAARALADRGVPVTVVERDAVANGGSSNLQGLTYAKPSHKHSPLTDFSVLSYMASVRFYAQRLHNGDLDANDGGQCGYLQLGEDQKILEYLWAFKDRELPFAALTSQQVSLTLGVPANQSGLNFPEAFWLNPEAVCRERLRHPLITLHERAGRTDWRAITNGWRVTTESRGSFDAKLLVLATAQQTNQHADTAWLPLQVIRGQTTHLEASESTRALKTAVCHEGYFPPPRLGIHCLGASYGPGDTSCEERAEEHQENLRKLTRALPQLDLDPPDQGHTGHVAHRCNSRDYLPIVGAIPDREAFNTVYKELSGRKTIQIDRPCPVVPGLYVMAGLGSRGLSAAPLAAELLASEILGEPSPVARYLHQALIPARFLKRALVRGSPL